MCLMVCAAVHCVGFAVSDDRTEVSGIAVSACSAFAAVTTSSGVGSFDAVMVSGSVVVSG